jgi:hypothetical protein
LKVNHGVLIGYGFLLLIYPIVGITVAGTQSNQDELTKLSSEELVHRYIRLDPIGDKRRSSIEDALKAKDPNEVFSTVAKTIDQYDPRKYTGRWPKKASDASWAIALLEFLDENHIRVRGSAGGYKAITAIEQMLERMKQAGYDSEKAKSLNARYRSDMRQLQHLKGNNIRDLLIARQLKEDYRLDISPDELKRFSDFLVAKDPRYVGWSKMGDVGNPPRHSFLDMNTYYQAYLEFKKSESREIGDARAPG